MGEGQLVTPSSPLRFSGMAKPGGAVLGSCAGGWGAGGAWVAGVVLGALIAMTSG